MILKVSSDAQWRRVVCATRGGRLRRTARLGGFGFGQRGSGASENSLDDFTEPFEARLSEPRTLSSFS